MFVLNNPEHRALSIPVLIWKALERTQGEWGQQRAETRNTSMEPEVGWLEILV